MRTANPESLGVRAPLSAGLLVQHWLMVFGGVVINPYELRPWPVSVKVYQDKRYLDNIPGAVWRLDYRRDRRRDKRNFDRLPFQPVIQIFSGDQILVGGSHQVQEDSSVLAFRVRPKEGRWKDLPSTYISAQEIDILSRWLRDKSSYLFAPQGDVRDTLLVTQVQLLQSPGEGPNNLFLENLSDVPENSLLFQVDLANTLAGSHTLYQSVAVRVILLELEDGTKYPVIIGIRPMPRHF
ncbi:MAG: hypothetical protein EA369_00985 [Bradymonadales bacterium]|nr:MAG: hypothetical protein EA369_00985 [Bradymonadales bacterium]